MSRKLITCVAVVSALAFAGVAGGVPTTLVPNGWVAAAIQVKKCKGVIAKIGGKKICIAEGKPCKDRYERAYERLGYVCRGGTLFEKPAVIPAAKVVATIPVGAAPESVRYLDGSIWARNNADGTVSRIDPATNTVVATIRVGDGEGDIAYGDGSIWVTSSEQGTLSRIDPLTNAVVATIVAGGPGDPIGLAWTPGAIWVGNHRHAATEKPTIARIDTATNRVVWTGGVGVASADSTGGPDKMTAAFGYVWFTVSNNNEVDRLDPDDNSITRIGTTCGDGFPEAVGESLWFSANCSHVLLRVDPVTNAIQTVPYPANGAVVGPIAGDGTFLWATMTPKLLVKFDPATGKVVGTWRHPAERALSLAAWLTFGDGSIWVSDFPRHRVLRLAP